MYFTREINRLMFGILLLFSIVAIAAAYWSVTGPDTILLRQDNPRLVQSEAAIRRGNILDRNGVILVTTEVNADRTLNRKYLYPEFASALGYSSLRYGVSGAESAFNSILRGDTIPSDFWEELLRILLHRPQQGSDIRLAFDLNVQKQAALALKDLVGSVIVLDVPSGEVISMVSVPTYDPNTLDESWEQLIQATGKPFFNRALQGTYQPGLALQTPLLAAAILAGYPTNTQFEGANRNIRLNDIELKCISNPPTSTLTLEQAYQFGCPYPFSQLVSELGIETVQSAFDTFALQSPLTLAGYTPSTNQETTDKSRPLLSASNFLANTLGQGNITVSPLEMAIMVAAIFNDGNAPLPHSLLQTRQPNSNVWKDDNAVYPSVPMLTATSAHQLQTIMETAVNEGAAQPAAQAGLSIGGHVSVAYVGDSAQTWFVGFARTDNSQGTAIALVLENTTDINLVSQIAGKILATAQHYRSINTSTPLPTTVP